MKFAEPIKLHRKSGIWGTRRFLSGTNSRRSGAFLPSGPIPFSMEVLSKDQNE